MHIIIQTHARIHLNNTLLEWLLSEIDNERYSSVAITQEENDRKINREEERDKDDDDDDNTFRHNDI